jgi:hypothetical protein
MDCSDGAKMLIDQMKEHPEEFRGYAGKFTSMLDMAREAAQGLSRHVKMSTRDAEAILVAAETHLYEVWLAEDVLTSIMQPKPEVEKSPYVTGTGRAVGKSVLSQMAGQAMSNSVFANNNIGANTATAQHIEQVYRMEQEKYRLELEQRRAQDYEYAQRNTKPFQSFL